MNFIEEYQFEDTSFLDDIIQYFKSSPNKSPGKIGYGKESVIDPKAKTSLDLSLNYEEVSKNIALKKYMASIQMAIDAYIKTYNFAGLFSPFGMEELNIQYYQPGESFSQWHTERSTKEMPMASRHIVFMTYLNDVLNGGETEFYYQKVKYVPKKGTTLVWPADWTHTHRGLPAQEEKYIITGWLDYIK